MALFCSECESYPLPQPPLNYRLTSHGRLVITMLQSYKEHITSITYTEIKFYLEGKCPQYTKWRGEASCKTKWVIMFYQF